MALLGVVEIYSIEGSFAAGLEDENIVTWGNKNGDDLRTVQVALIGFDLNVYHLGSLLQCCMIFRYSLGGWADWPISCWIRSRGGNPKHLRQ